MESKQHVDLIIFTMAIQGETLPSAILGDAHVYASMCVPYTYRDINTHTYTLYSQPNTISYKRKIFQQKIIILQ